ncbi:MAG: hypothetical protein CVT82_03845 [Alphaproteobacteria bacterium HGW-Alphaproteobacteria-4]|jgi:hypothetical protein|nr:MAG: hypothetical protein CVT82_03845 [Alphaproteobacteria bacterium HGW-Alphaproteobacteria-4]
MRNLMLAACVLATTATAALSGGYVAPTVEAKPIVAASPSSNPSVFPVIVLVLVGLVYATSSRGKD